MAELVKKADLGGLDILQPDHPVFEVNGQKVVVKPFTFGKLLKAIKHLTNLLNSLVVLESKEGSSMATMLAMFATHTEDVLALISLSTDKPVDFYDEISAEAGIDIALAVYEVNKSFFTENLLPKVSHLFQPLLEEAESAQTEAEAQAETTSGETKKKSKKSGSTSSKS